MEAAKQPSNQKIIQDLDDPLKAAQVFGLAKTRAMYEEAINEWFRDRNVMKMLCLKYAELELSNGQMQCVQNLYCLAAIYVDTTDHDFWNLWQHFVEQHGDYGMRKEMLRDKKYFTTRPSVNVPKN